MNVLTSVGTAFGCIFGLLGLVYLYVDLKIEPIADDVHDIKVSVEKLEDMYRYENTISRSTPDSRFLSSPDPVGHSRDTRY